MRTVTVYMLNVTYLEGHYNGSIAVAAGIQATGIELEDSNKNLLPVDVEISKKREKGELTLSLVIMLVVNLLLSINQ